MSIVQSNSATVSISFNSNASAPFDESGHEQIGLSNPSSAPSESLQQCQGARQEANSTAGRPVWTRIVSFHNRIRRRIDNKSFCRENIPNGLMGLVCIPEAVFSGFLLFVGIFCAINMRSFCPLLAALWTLIPLGSGFMGVKAAKTDVVNYYVIHLVFSVVAFTLYFLLPAIVRNFISISIHKHKQPHEQNDHNDDGICRMCFFMGEMGPNTQFAIEIIFGFLFLTAAVLSLLRIFFGYGKNEDDVNNGI